MAGLPCDYCAEDTYIIPMGEVLDDADGRTIYRRYRACVNPKCNLYRHRRESWEFLLPETKIKIVDTVQLRQYLPEDDPGVGLQPNLFEIT